MPEVLDASEMAKRWIAAYDDGTPKSYGSDRFLDLYAEGVDWQEMPTPANPGGRSGDRRALREALQISHSLFRDRHVVLKEVVGGVGGECAAFRYEWSARLIVDRPPRTAGSLLRYQVAAFVEVHDGLITRIVEYVAAG